MDWSWRVAFFVRKVLIRAKDFACLLTNIKKESTLKEACRKTCDPPVVANKIGLALPNLKKIYWRPSPAKPGPTDPNYGRTSPNGTKPQELRWNYCVPGGYVDPLQDVRFILQWKKKKETSRKSILNNWD